MLRIGFAEADITPPLGQRVIGHFDDIRVERILDPLGARAMVIEGNETLAFVTCDLLSLRRSTITSARERITAATGIPAEQIAVSATHTHTGPATGRIFGMDPDPDYLEQVVVGVTEAVTQAWERRTPAVLTAAYGFEGKLSHQRRFIMRDGQAQMHPPKGGTDILYQEGPSDPEFGVLWAEGTDGKPLGCWVNYSCHVNVVGGGTGVSADYPGHLNRALRRHQHEDFVTIFANGCCANLCQIDVYDPCRHDSGMEWSKYMGETLAEDVLRALPEGERLTEAALDHRSAVIPMPLRHVSDELLAWADGIRARGEAEPFVERCYADMAYELVAAKRLEPTVPAEIGAFRLGEYGIVTLPAEVFVEFGLDIKLRSPAKRTWVIELANGIVGYVPTRRAFEGGGYEQRTATSSKLDPVAGEMMVATAHALLDSMFR
jgi:hypothetical protein